MKGPPRALTNLTLVAAAKELGQRDPDLRRVLDRVGVPPLWGRRPGFPTLVRIILEQQVSLAAAASLYRRLSRELGGMTVERVQAVGEAGLRRLGVTRQKARYVSGLAARVVAGSLDLRRAAALPDDQGRALLLSVPGLGPWSVDIYSLMALRRPDIWPEGDMALASALGEVKRLKAAPDLDTQRGLAAAWAPWRSVAARILWAHYLEERGLYRR